MKLNWSKFVLFSAYLSVLFFGSTLMAGTNSNFHLRAYVPHSIKTSFKEKRLANNRLLWLLTSQMNTQHPFEGQTFEVEGMNQGGLEAKIKTIMGNDRTIRHEILLESLKKSATNDRTIFLKISAN